MSFFEDQLVAGKLYSRPAAELTELQRKSASTHLLRDHFDSAASALAQVEMAEISVTFVGYKDHWSGKIKLRRCAITSTATIDQHPVIGHSFSYRSPRIFDFVSDRLDESARVTRITASRSRLAELLGVDLYGAASTEREATSFLSSGFEEVRTRAVNARCVDLVTELSSGHQHRWFVMEEAERLRQHEERMKDADRARAIMDNLQRRTATPAERAEWTRIAGKVSAIGIGALELSVDKATTPANEPSISLQDGLKLLAAQ